MAYAIEMSAHFYNVIFQAIKIELKIAMRKKHIIPTRKVNMYSNRLKS